MAEPVTDLFSRDGLPDDLRALLQRYPRQVWKGHARLGAMAQFWLARHDMFRELGTALDDATARYRSGEVNGEDFAAFFAPRLQFLLQQLEEHHHVEDMHYFPLLRAAESSLGKGFDLLENDHGAIHGAIAQSADAANDFLRAMFAAREAAPSAQGAPAPAGGGGLGRGPSASPSQTDSKILSAADSYAAVNARLLHILTRHLADEEDLIVPLVLDRGEDALGVG